MDKALQGGSTTGDDDAGQEDGLVHSARDGSANGAAAASCRTSPWVAVAGLMMLGLFAGSTFWLQHNHVRVTSLSTKTIVMQGGDGAGDYGADGKALAEGPNADGAGDGESATGSVMSNGETAEGALADVGTATQGGYSDGEVSTAGSAVDGEPAAEGGTSDTQSGMEAGAAAAAAGSTAEPAAESQQDSPPDSVAEPMTQEEISDLVRQAGDEHAADRGSRKGKYRSDVQRIFNGTHVTGDTAPGVQDFRSILDFIARHPDFKDLYHKPAFGPVILSKPAEMLRATLKQQGFSNSILYHGTKSAYVPTILSMGFMVSGGENGGQAWHGTGIYACISLAHAQCYGGGESIIKMEGYWNPQNKSRFMRRVNHDSEANDVFVITDPLLLIPVEVIKCCPEELTCI
eukprot:TRINITY_DN88474_c0_g1_i1.p1 TRINITY_DN88474_c0_g1~~TRINITY_DN88474_c0_g1_i1.p1  ORF type:complete len:403 (+),score=74.12 TRINITY_DN88474_c0_g1_i1:46-1254(+)